MKKKSTGCLYLQWNAKNINILEKKKMMAFATNTFNWSFHPLSPECNKTIQALILLS